MNRPVAPAFSPFASLGPATDQLLHGSGFACAFKNVGFSFGFPERCEARIVLHGDPDDPDPVRAELYHAGADVGQGAHTAFLQMAADAVGLPLDQVEVLAFDLEANGYPSGSSSPMGAFSLAAES